MNGDGMDDLVLSAVFADPLGRDKAGLVALVLGSDSFSPNQVIDLNVFTPAAWLVGGAANDRIGFALECGDLNGDSLDDIVVGAHLTAATAGAEAGRCSVVYGNRVIPPGTTIDFISPSAGTGAVHSTAYTAAWKLPPPPIPIRPPALWACRWR